MCICIYIYIYVYITPEEGRYFGPQVGFRTVYVDRCIGGLGL